MVSEGRWADAQSYEQEYWARTAEELAAGAGDDLSWYAWRAERLLEELDSIGRPFGGPDQLRVLEIGSGPVGLAAHLPAPVRVAVDPLERFYAEMPELKELRDPEVDYREGPGEDLPCSADAFDLVVTENCIDHVRDPDEVMREIVRVLRPGGGLYLTVNCRTRLGYGVHRLLSNLRIDRGHPHTFTRNRVRALVERHGFEPQIFESGSYPRALMDDLRGASPQARLKGLLGVSEFVTRVIAAGPA